MFYSEDENSLAFMDKDGNKIKLIIIAAMHTTRHVFALSTRVLSELDEVRALKISEIHNMLSIIAGTGEQVEVPPGNKSVWAGRTWNINTFRI